MKKSDRESGDQVKLFTQRSSVSVRLVMPPGRALQHHQAPTVAFISRRGTARATPGTCRRANSAGWNRRPGVLVILRTACPPADETTNRSVLVLMAGTGSAFME